MATFEPVKVGNLQLQHRIVMAPMTRYRSSEKGVPTDLVVEYYRQRATPGGLLITEGTIVSPNAGAYPYVPGIYTEEQIEAWSKITKAVHEKGGYIFSQIWHFGRTGSAKYSQDQKPAPAPSAIAVKGPNIYIQPIGSEDFEVPREATKEDIKVIINDFAVAAKNAIRAGFDGVEIHGANGYLVDQFINSSSNKRTDEYGGSIENRVRLPVEVAEAVANAVGPERTAIRLSPFSGVQGVEDDTPYETWTEVLKNLNPNLAYVHLVEPREDFAHQHPDLDNTLDPFRKVWKGPFISAGGYTTNVDLIEKVAKETGNLIGIGRGYIANPDLVKRLKNNLPLNKYNRDTFYAQGPVGYTDYPFYTEA